MQEDKNWWKDKLKADDLDDFQIDTRGTFADGGLGLSATNNAKPAPKSNTNNSTSTNNTSNNSASNSTTTTSSNSGNNSNSSSGNSNIHSTGNSAKVAPSRKLPNSVAAVVPATPIARPLLKTGGPPIIIVPSAITSLITMYNIKDFLENGVYVPTIDKKKVAPNKESRVVINKMRGKDLPSVFHVIDSTTKMTSKDWERVVGVFVLGQGWQFKDWHWSTPVELFSNVRGFYLKYDDAVFPPEVKAWNVKPLTISKSKRHLDQTAALQFWNTLDDFMLRRH